MNVEYLAVELWVVALAIGVLLVDLWLPKDRKPVLAWLAGLGMLVALIISFAAHGFLDGADRVTALRDLFVLDGFALFFKKIFAIIGLLVIVLSRSYIKRVDEDGQGEFYVLMLFALLGMMLVSSVGDFLSLFVSLELITVSFYVLVAYKRTDALSVEAGLKYIIIGALASSFLLFGIALVYGATGEVRFDAVKAILAAPAAEGAAPIAGRIDFLLGAVLIVSGLGFKIAAVPFHVWAPDVYMGAPTPVTAFLSVGSKAAGFVLLLRVMTTVGGAVGESLTMLLAILAAITVFYGNLAAIPQRNIKRLLGYSTIGHAGYLLMGVAVMNKMGANAVLYYLLGYVFTNVAAFSVVIIVGRSEKSHSLEAYEGLSKRSPMLAACLTVALLSLAGIPPLAGFFGKFLILAAVLENPNLLWLVAVGALNVVISMYYYLCVIKRMYVFEPRREGAIEVPIGPKVVMLACILLIIVIGIVQGPFVDMTWSVADVFATF